MKFVTLVTESFLPGLAALYQSMLDNSGLKNDEIEFILLLPEGTDAESMQGRLGKGNFSFLKLGDLGEVEIDRSLLKNPKKWLTMQRLLVFKLPYEEILCHIDTDLLCLNNMTSLKDYTHFTAGLNIGREPNLNVHGYPMFNAGFYLFKPSVGLFNEMQAYILEEAAEDVFSGEAGGYGDQAVLNGFLYKYYPKSVSHFSLEWNVAISQKQFHPELWRQAKKEGIKLLHYTQLKPWEPFSPKQYQDRGKTRAFLSNKFRQLKHRRKTHRRYGEEYRLWHHYYSRFLNRRKAEGAA